MLPLFKPHLARALSSERAALAAGRSVDSPHLRSWRDLLRLEPWTWPAEGSEADLAIRLSGAGPPALRPGDTLLISVDAGHGDLWLLRFDESAPLALARRVGFRQGLSSWASAWSALPGALPLLWQSLRIAPSSPPEAYWLTPRDQVPLHLEGDSFGLSFLLGLASLILEVPVDLAVAASAAVAGDGSLGPVEGLETKIATLAREAPRVRRLLVAACQETEAERARQRCRATLRIVPCSSAHGAVREALSPAAGRAVAGGPDRMVKTLVRLALGPDRSAAVEWTAVEQAAETALAQPDLAPDSQEQLRFARAVAARHAGRLRPLPWPTDDLLRTVAEPARTRLLAHGLQHLADGGAVMPTRTPGEALEAAHARIRRGLDAFPADLELLGATARLLAVTGQPTEALARQLEAARGWAIRSGEVGLSFPLAEGYRLAVGLADGAAFAALEALHAEGLAQRMLRQPADTRFVDLWHGEALARFGRPDEGRAVLTAVFAASGGLYPGVGAARALSALLPRDEATALGAQLLSYRARFEREATPHTAERVADIDSTLARIDLAAACRDEHPTLARHALERLRALSPGLMGILTNHAPPEARASELDLGRYVARFYSG